MDMGAAVMAKRYLYVLSSYVGENVASLVPGEPAFEYQHFVRRTKTDVVSLSSLGIDGEGIKTRLTGRLLIQRLRLAALVARRSDRYDAIIASGEDIGILVALALRIARRRTPLVMVTHGPQFQSPKFRLVLSMVKSMPNVVFACLSRSLADWLVAHHGIDPRRCQATGYGIDTDYFHTDPASTQAMVASAGSSNRDYDTLVLAVTPTGIDTRIAAHSTWVGAAATVKATTPDHVEVRSYGNYANLRDLYRHARVVVVPTHDVPFAAGFAVIAEAMATGTPVIATHGRVTSDFVVPGVTGLLVPPGDVDALRQAIVSLVSDPDRAAAMGVAAAKLMRERYSLGEYVRRLETAAGLPR
jgi:glycosyltransferase involved in cell wall biosynthesis